MNERPRWYSCHFRVAGCCLAISSGRRQYDATKVLIPSHGERVTALGFVYFTKRLVRPVRVIEQKSADTQNEWVVRVQGNRTVKTDFSLPELTQVQESKAGGEMSVGLVGVELQCGFCHLQSGMQMIRIVVDPVEFDGLDKAEHGVGSSKPRIELYRLAQKGFRFVRRVS